MRLGVVCVRAAAVALVVLWLDQLTKSAINNSILPGQHRPFLPDVQLENAHNHGYLLGFGFVGTETRVILGLVAMVTVAVVLTVWLLAQLRSSEPQRRARGWSVYRSIWLPIGLMLGCGLGNMGELITQGSVTDFIHITGSRFVFNLADAAGLLGTLIMLLITKPGHTEGHARRGKPQIPPPDALA